MVSKQRMGFLLFMVTVYSYALNMQVLTNPPTMGHAPTSELLSGLLPQINNSV